MEEKVPVTQIEYQQKLSKDPFHLKSVIFWGEPISIHVYVCNVLHFTCDSTHKLCQGISFIVFEMGLIKKCDLPAMHYNNNNC